MAGDIIINKHRFIGKMLSAIIPKKASRYIFFTFGKEVFMWFAVLFVVLATFNQIGMSTENYKLSFLIMENICETSCQILKLTEFVILFACITYFLRSKGFFNLSMLQSFGTTSMQTLVPIIVFLVMFWTLRVFIFHPLVVKYSNLQSIYKKEHKLSIVSTDTKFNIFDGKKEGNYMVVSGTYKGGNKDVIIAHDATLLKYHNNKLIETYYAKMAKFDKSKWMMRDVLYYNHKKETLAHKQSSSIKSELTITKLMSNISGANKYEKSLRLHVYDNIRLLVLNKNKNGETDALRQARLETANDIICLMNSIVCCFLTFILCITSSRVSNIIKISLKSFLAFFILTRIFSFLGPTIKNSNINAFVAIMLSVTIASSFYTFLINRDWKIKVFGNRKMVGDTGLKPVTLSTSRKCSIN